MKRGRAKSLYIYTYLNIHIMSSVLRGLYMAYITPLAFPKFQCSSGFTSRLGAGIGRFSGVLARKARKVTAVDFVATSCVENRKANAEKNLEVIQAMGFSGSG